MASVTLELIKGSLIFYLNMMNITNMTHKIDIKTKKSTITVNMLNLRRFMRSEYLSNLLLWAWSQSIKNLIELKIIHIDFYIFPKLQELYLKLKKSKLLRTLIDKLW